MTQPVDAQEFNYKLLHVYAQASSEIPSSPEALEFKETPRLDMQLGIRNRKNSDDSFTVDLIVTVKAIVNTPQDTQDTQDTQEQKIVFLIEVKQHGVFSVSSQNEFQLTQLLNILSPSLLYPYASAFVSDLASRAGFPSLHLPNLTVNDFESLYHQQTEST